MEVMIIQAADVPANLLPSILKYYLIFINENHPCTMNLAHCKPSINYLFFTFISKSFNPVDFVSQFEDVWLPIQEVFSIRNVWNSIEFEAL